MNQIPTEEPSPYRWIKGTVPTEKVVCPFFKTNIQWVLSITSFILIIRNVFFLKSFVNN